MTTKHIVMAAGLLAAAGVFSQWPLFQIVPLDGSQTLQSEVVFDAAKFAESFWIERLAPLLDRAVDVADAATVLAALRDDPQQAGERFGRSVGVSRARLFCVRGSGTIVAVDRHGIGVSLIGASQPPDLVLQTGPLFGNSVRDISGLLRAGDFANSQHFNDISTELNRIVESRIIAPLQRGARIGRQIQFIACGQVASNLTTSTQLKLIPLKCIIE